MGPSRAKSRAFALDGTAHTLLVETAADDLVQVKRSDGNAAPRAVRVLLGGASPIVLVDGRVVSLTRAGSSKAFTFTHQGSSHQLELGTSAFSAHSRSAGALSGPVVAPMPGRVLEVRVVVGEAVEVGSPLAVIEAMKMQNEILSPRAGRVARVLISPEVTIERGAILVEIV